MSANGGGSGGGDLSAKDKYELGFQRESWCAVEMKKEQDWCRATRKHYGENFKSTAFSPGAVDSEPRCTFQVNKPTHLQRRHFPENYQNQLKL